MNKVKASAAFETFIVPRINKGLREAAFWVLAGLSLILLLALLSYNKADPAFTVAGGDEAVTNRMGPAGAWFADVAFLLFGASAYLFPILVLIAAVFLFRGEELPDGFRSDPNFYYLTGVDEEGAVLVLAPGERIYREFLFLRSIDPEAERWVGPRPTLGDSLRDALGFENVLRAGSLNSTLARLVSHHPTLHLIASPAPLSAPVTPEQELYAKITARHPGVRWAYAPPESSHVSVTKGNR